MSKAFSLFLIVTLVALLFSATARAQGVPEARILTITATTEVAEVQSPYNNKESRRLPKFAPAGHRVSQAVLVVDWQTVRALPAGALVRFSYRRPGSEVVRNLDRRYDQAVTGRQQCRFAVNLEDPARDRVAAWRVQILHRDLVLDEQRSAAWK